MSENGLPALVSEDLFDLRPPLAILRLARHGPDLCPSAVLGLWVAFDSAQDACLVQGGRAAAEIVVGCEAVDFHRWVADELQRSVKSPALSQHTVTTCGW